MDLTVSFTPLEVTKPVSWIGCNLDLTGGTSEEESELISVHLLLTEHDVDGEFEREQ
jgi:hypothetical protein